MIDSTVPGLRQQPGQDRVPICVRGYCRERQWADLLNNVLAAARGRPHNTGRLLGSDPDENADDAPWVTLIDGRQRLITVGC
ncbi:hypothetical protein [Deinococcus aerophilus]|uniref:hypothetical protein n=1 Tax=Deinococcus aerophilus TaxID=522488 RepID=UPI001665B985|nr:hypothetical protein [Deinococcus aerophilus]